MRHLQTVAWILCLTVLGGCGAQSTLLDAESSYFFTAPDALALPGEAVTLQARLEAGDLLQSQPGYVVRFWRDGELYKAAETGNDGRAAVTFIPEKPGMYIFKADLSPNGFAKQPPAPRELLVACREADTSSLVVDLDKTVVADGFEEVLIGDPDPMPESPRVLGRLAEQYGVIYLTHRPDYFGPKSKDWLRRNGFPEAPLLLSDISGFLGGSGEFKTEAIRRLRARFKNIEFGVGDKISDVQSYYDNGMRGFLIIGAWDLDTREQLEQAAADLEALSAEAQVVTTWSQIEQAVFEGASFPRERAQQMLRDRAAEMPETQPAMESSEQTPSQGADQ